MWDTTDDVNKIRAFAAATDMLRQPLLLLMRLDNRGITSDVLIAIYVNRSALRSVTFGLVGPVKLLMFGLVRGGGGRWRVGRCAVIGQ